ncbi:hypothetical protein D3C83_209490 [compost metagenome]
METLAGGGEQTSVENRVEATYVDHHVVAVAKGVELVEDVTVFHFHPTDVRGFAPERHDADAGAVVGLPAEGKALVDERV